MSYTVYSQYNYSNTLSYIITIVQLVNTYSIRSHCKNIFYNPINSAIGGIFVPNLPTLDHLLHHIVIETTQNSKMVRRDSRKPGLVQNIM